MIKDVRLRILWNKLDAFPAKTEAEIERICHIVGQEIDAMRFARCNDPYCVTWAETGLPPKEDHSILEL